MINNSEDLESHYIAINYKNITDSEIHCKMKLTLTKLLTINVFIIILSVRSGSPKPEFKIIIHLDEETANEQVVTGKVNS